MFPLPTLVTSWGNGRMLNRQNREQLVQLSDKLGNSAVCEKVHSQRLLYESLWTPRVQPTHIEHMQWLCVRMCG